MAKRRIALKPDSTGQYFRQIGHKINSKSQPKFRLGRDRAKADLAYHRLGALWEIVLDQHRQQSTGGNFPPPTVKMNDCPVWTEEALLIAEAIRTHQHTLRVCQPTYVNGSAAYATYLDYLRQTYGHLVHIVPEDEATAEEGRQQHANHARHRALKAQLAARIASIPIPAGLVGMTLHQAINDYVEHVKKHNAKESGKVEAGNARRIKNAIHDMDLSEFGYSAMEKIREYWAARPEVKLRGDKRAGRPISLATVDNHLSTARRFVRWLDRADAYKWELPRHGLDALTVNLRRLQTDQEVSDQRHGVQVFNTQQLTTIWKHATDFERLLVLLGLNAAMAQAEIRTLRQDEVENDPAMIKRIRRKSGVYGEFALWPETVRAFAWWQRVRPAQGDLVMLTHSGNAYTRQRISNQWTTLRNRIERKTGEVRSWWLSFKHLRKTAAQFVREVSDGEIAGVFLSHGNPVVSDSLADVYSNRPFNRVAEALSTVHGKLASMFRSAPDAFSSECIGRGPHRRKDATKTN